MLIEPHAIDKVQDAQPRAHPTDNTQALAPGKPAPDVSERWILDVVR